jgi:tetratricopeptide (TPR) repeat protein
MEDLDDKILKYLADINRKKEEIRRNLDRSREVYETYSRKKARKLRRLVYSWGSVGIAAAALLAFIFVPSLTRFDSDRKFTESYHRFTFELNERGTTDNDPLSRSAAFYQHGNNDEAIRLSDSLLEVSPDNLKAQFIKGLAELDRQDWDGARKSLERVAAGDGVMGVSAHWYLGLIDMKTGRYREAAKQFQIVKNSSTGPEADQAFRFFSRLRFRKDR